MSGDDYSISIGGDVSGVVGAGREVRQNQRGEASGGAGSTLKILFVAANPRDTDSLRLGEEVRTIDERLRGSEHGDQIELSQHWAVRISDLSDVLLRHRPDILHFSGHGSPVGSIILEDETGHSVDVSAKALAELLRIVARDLRCVVLNACYSAAQATFLTENVDTVVGTAKAIGDDAAIRFAGGFYRAVGYGESVKTAFDLGRNEIDLASLGEEDTPRLLHGHAVDPGQVYLIEPHA